jgi:hypothetical protein
MTAGAHFGCGPDHEALACGARRARGWQLGAHGRRPDVTGPTPGMDIADVSLGQDRAAAERALEAAQRNPVLSGEQACAVAQLHALLAIEHAPAERAVADQLAVIFTPRRGHHLSCCRCWLSRAAWRV